MIFKKKTFRGKLCEASTTLGRLWTRWRTCASKCTCAVSIENVFCELKVSICLIDIRQMSLLKKKQFIFTVGQSNNKKAWA